MLRQAFGRLAGGVLCLAALVVASSGALAIDQGQYSVTITNLTKGQVFSPPIATLHPSDISVFTAGQPASDELIALAEEGDNSLLETFLLNAGADVEIALGPLPPGQSVTLNISSTIEGAVLSVLGMLVTTNDAFFALNGAAIGPSVDSGMTFSVPAYDAGSEDNNELCKFIPGPPCDSPGVRDTNGAEGFVHIHNGVHGVFSFGNRRLKASRDDWRNPVARITVEAAME